MKRNINYKIIPALVVLTILLAMSIIYAWSGSVGLDHACNDSRTCVKIPILMYHGITNVPGRVNSYFISQDLFENDLKYITENGYTTISMSKLVAYVAYGAALPEKPVVITFDDGYCNNYLYAYPLLKKYNCCALISVIGKPTEEDAAADYRTEEWCKCTWDQLTEMSKSSTFELGNHTYNLHTSAKGRHGASRLPWENLQSYLKFLEKDLMKNQNLLAEKTGIIPQVFCWPFGANSTEADAALKDMGFNATLGCSEGINTFTQGQPDCLFNLKRNLRSPNRPIQKLLCEGE